MRVRAPHAVDETLLYEVVYIFSVLNQKNVYVVLETKCWVDHCGVVGCRALTHFLEHVWLKVGPKKTTHTLNGVAHMVRCGHIDAGPAKALAYDPSLLIDEIIVWKLVIDLALQMPDRWLTLVLFV